MGFLYPGQYTPSTSMMEFLTLEILGRAHWTAGNGKGDVTLPLGHSLVLACGVLLPMLMLPTYPYVLPLPLLPIAQQGSLQPAQWHAQGRTVGSFAIQQAHGAVCRATSPLIQCL